MQYVLLVFITLNGSSFVEITSWHRQTLELCKVTGQEYIDTSYLSSTKRRQMGVQLNEHTPKMFFVCRPAGSFDRR